MDRLKTRWEYTIKETCNDGQVKEHILQGRTFSSLDMAPILRKAGVPPGPSAFSTVAMQYGDILAEVLLTKCITSHKIGTGPGCDFAPTDLNPQEVDAMVDLILRPVKYQMAKVALEQGGGLVAKALPPEQLADLMENGWFSPEEQAAIELELSLAEGDST